MSAFTAASYAGVGTAYVVRTESLSDDDDDDGRFVLHGVALGVGDITIGQSGTKKIWPADALREAAETLAGQPLVRNHTNTTEGKVGEVTHAEFVDGVGIVYEAEVASHYDELIDDIEAGLMDVSVRAFHPKEDDLETDEETGALIVDVLVFDNLSLVTKGASPSNSAESGALDIDNIDVASAEASAVFDGGVATATLSRSVPTDQETVEASYACDSVERYDDCRIETDYASITLDHQSSDGESITVTSAWSEIPFWVCAHADGYEYVHEFSALSGSLGETGPFEAGEEVTDVEIQLDEPLDESQTLYATLHMSTADGEKGSHITAEHGYIQDYAVIVVENDADEMSEGALFDVAEYDPDDVCYDAHLGDGAGAEATAEELAPEGIRTADGTWFAVGPDEHSDDTTDWPGDHKYPLTSCTGDNSVEAAWNLRSHGDYTISQETLEARIRRAADVMGCDPSVVGLDEDESNGAALEETETEYGPDHPDVFASREEAEDRAEEIGLGRTSHEHDIDGETYYMPGETMGDYRDAVAEKADHDDEDEDEDVDEYAADTDTTDTDVAELADYVFSEAHYEEAGAGDVDGLTLDVWGFDDWDEMNDIEREVVSEHFLLADSEFPPESFDDLALPVVDAGGTLSRDALVDARETVEDIVDDDDELVETVRDWIETTIDAEFDTTEAGTNRDTVATSSTPVSVDQLASIQPTTMIEFTTALDAEELEDELDEPVVVEREELESLSETAQKAEDVEGELEALAGKLDEQNDAREVVADLSESELELLQSDEDDVAIVEAKKAEMVDDVSQIYAEELAKYSPFEAEELADRFDPLDLRSRVEDHDEASLSASIGDVEPEPEAGDVTEEELGDTTPDDERDEEELRAEYASQLEQQGWTSQAEKVRSGELPLTHRQ